MPEDDNNTLERRPEKPIAGLVQVGERGMVLRSFEELYQFAALCVKNGAAPKGMSAGAAAVAIQAGLERGLMPVSALQACVVINGVLSWRGHAAAALIRNSSLVKPGTFRFWCEGEGEEMKGVAEAWRVGDTKLSRVEFSVKDARLAHLWGKQGPWQEYPKRQLMWRALGFLARDVFSDVLGGFPIDSEAADYRDIPGQAKANAQEADARASLPAPAVADPILDAIDGKELSEPIDVEATETSPTESEPESAERDAGEADDDDKPPFPSHEEADRELAEEEQENLFRGGGNT